jgi:DNA-nicking Smr family endonuclease
MPDDDAFVVPITDELDLHAFAPRDVASIVLEYVRAARAQGLVEVRIVHGRGKGVQRAIVHRVLQGLPEVRGFSDAPPISGHWGACLVTLHPP